jgi:hypothetical protein
VEVGRRGRERGAQEVLDAGLELRSEDGGEHVASIVLQRV